MNMTTSDKLQVPKTIAKYMRLDKPSIEMRERIPVGEWYDDGKTNEMFKMFLHGCEYGEKIATQ